MFHTEPATIPGLRFRHFLRSQSAKTTGDVDLSARLQAAQSDPKLNESLFKTGRKVAAFCANCHGEGGNSPKADTPNLAGGPAYALLRQFADAVATKFMEGMIKAMTSWEGRDGVFYAASRHPSLPYRRWWLGKGIPLPAMKDGRGGVASPGSSPVPDGHAQTRVGQNFDPLRPPTQLDRCRH
jgi:hypothetical protein